MIYNNKNMDLKIKKFYPNRDISQLERFLSSEDITIHHTSEFSGKYTDSATIVIFYTENNHELDNIMK